jgi:hypothetical protein
VAVNLLAARKYLVASDGHMAAAVLIAQREAGSQEVD